MAYDALRQFNEDDEEKKRAEEQQYKLGPAVAGGAPSAWQPQQSMPANVPNSPGRFVNFSKYFDLNKEKAGTMAGAVADPLQKNAADAETRRQQATGAFNTQADRRTLKWGGEHVGGAQPQQATNFRTQRGIENMVQATNGARPVQRMPSAAITRDEAAARASSVYSGPTSLEQSMGADPYKTLISDTEKSDQKMKLLGTDEGRQALIGDVYGAEGGYAGTGGATSGKSRLDAALAGTAGGKRFSDLQSRYGNLSKQLTDADAAAVAYANQAAGKTAAAAGKYGEAVGANDKALAEKAAQNQPYLVKAAGGTVGQVPWGKQDANSPQMRAFAGFTWGNGEADAKRVYESLTPEEWAALGEMDIDAATAWLRSRADSVGVTTGDIADPLNVRKK